MTSGTELRGTQQKAAQAVKYALMVFMKNCGEEGEDNNWPFISLAKSILFQLSPKVMKGGQSCG
ncbi:MAG: hypothetical protein HYZ77_01215 [Serratia liquefaciens]|nr:hypothetical protein [Serratia liquefaciens]